MKLIHQLPAFLFTAAAVVWKKKDLAGTYEATGNGPHEFSVIHFGERDVLIKKKEGRNVGENLKIGKWFPGKKDSTIEEYLDGSKAQLVRVEGPTVDTIIYSGTTFVRAKKPTDLDTLAMVHKSRCVPIAPNSTFRSVIFLIREMLLFYKLKPMVIEVSFGWDANVFTKDSINGTMTNENTREKASVYFEKKSEKTLKFFEELFTCKPIK
ncbi:hypothetical protein DSO57_1018236 [Entomophthora muscae]|uniref:Uncharacterized protein n=1 Tax=Entomophthora muscae TaxID=34485 RepID=A0ACC2TRM3_9FUNG|nr:hypothetical protein DSO57_1018236 [Entomophthora muscae]